MREMSVSEFRKNCLTLMDNLPAEGILITKHGHPVARLEPATQRSCEDFIGSVPGLVIDATDDLFTTGIHWDAES